MMSLAALKEADALADKDSGTVSKARGLPPAL